MQPWRIEVNPDVSVMSDGDRCVIGGVVSVSFALDEVEFVWTENGEGVLEPSGLLQLRLRDRSDTIASIRLKRREAEQVRTMLEAGGPVRH